MSKFMYNVYNSSISTVQCLYNKSPDFSSDVVNINNEEKIKRKVDINSSLNDA